MSQNENPLDQLRDIHLPEQLDSIQIAPIWWIMLALILAGVVYLIYRLMKKRQSLRMLKPAKLELQQIAQMAPDNHSIALLSALLKRICLLYFPKRKIASLNGDQWINFLNQQAQVLIFDHTLSQLFCQTAYQPNATIELGLWQRLIAQSEMAIEVIIHQAAREQRK